MKQQANTERRRRAIPVRLAIVVLIPAIAAAAWWSSPSAPRSVEGTPRLVVDHDTIELGDLRFAAPARAVFTLTNTGTGSLRIVDAPRVKALKGC